MKEVCHVKFDVISAFERPQVSPSGRTRCPAMPRCLLESKFSKCLHTAADKGRAGRGKRGLRRCADQLGKSPLVVGNSGVGHLGDHLGRAKAASARAIPPAPLSW